MFMETNTPAHTRMCMEEMCVIKNKYVYLYLFCSQYQNAATAGPSKMITQNSRNLSIRHDSQTPLKQRKSRYE
jgi:hypothetical protein